MNCIQFVKGCFAAFLIIGPTHLLGDDWEPLPKNAAIQGDSPDKIELGKKLFFDPRLSATGTVSCNTCHNLMEGGDDGRPTSMGVDGLTGPRNAPTVWNSVFQSSQFWDGRADTLEEQAKGPMIADVEMGMGAHTQVLSRIKLIPAYVLEFKKAFGESDSVTIENTVSAIAAFERTLITPNSNFDKFLSGDSKAMSPMAIQGMELFDSLGCTECHSGPALNGWTPETRTAEFAEFPRNMESQYLTRYDLLSDKGRLEATKKKEDAQQFKTPTLRNITLTAPYMHNGNVPSLEEACRVMANTQLDMELDDEEVSQLTAFFKELEGEFPEIVLPRIPSRSGHSVIEPHTDSTKQSL